MDTVKVFDKTFKLYLSEAQILAEVDRVAAQMNEDLRDKNPLFVCVLNGAFVFASDLYRRFKHPSQIAFIRLKSYIGTSSSGTVNLVTGLTESVQGRTVVVVEDIVETGLSMQLLMQHLTELGAEDVRLAILLNKPNAHKVDGLKIDYCCFEIPNDFIVGYGLDYEEEGRGLRDIYVVGE